MSTQVPTLREWVRDHDEKWLFVVLYLGLAVGLSVLVSLFWLLVVAVLHLILELARQAHYREGKVTVLLHALWEVKLDVALILLALTLVLYIEVVLGLLGVQSAGRAVAVSRAGSRVATRAAAWERNLRTFLLTVDEMARIAYAGIMLRRKRREGRGSAATSGPDGVAPAPAVGPGATGDTPEEAGPGRPEGEGPPASVEDRQGVESSAPAGKGAATEPKGPADRGQETTVGPGRQGGPGEPIPPVWRQGWKVVDYVGLGLVAAGIVFILAAPWLTTHDWASVGASLLDELRPFPGPSAPG